MATSLAQNGQPRDKYDGRGRKEPPVMAGAPETMNLQCAVLDLLKICGESARVFRSKADEIDRVARNTAMAYAAHRDSVAAHERKALA